MGTQYWFNVTSGQVETDENKSRGEVLMGPYASYEEAARALESARERTEAWDEEDRRWEEGEVPPWRPDGTTPDGGSSDG
jgi:hypothetical protein